jgi:hypothetical protein
MIFHFALLLWTAVFSLWLGYVAFHPTDPSWGQYALSILPLVAVSLLASRKITGIFSGAFLSVLLSVTAPVLLSLIDRPIEREAFVVLSGLMYYFSLLGIYRLRHAPNDRTAQSILNTSAMAAMFFCYAGLYGFYLNFSFPLWGLMILYFLGSTLVSRETFIDVDRGEGSPRVILYSVLIGFVMGEMAWVSSLWPFGYLTVGAIDLTLFFMAWDVASDAFRKELSLKKAVVRILFFVVIIALLLLSSSWRILV